MLNHIFPSQEPRSFATNCISEAVKSAEVTGCINALNLWQRVFKKLTPFTNSNQFGFCPLHFELFGYRDEGCFQVMELRFISGVFR